MLLKLMKENLTVETLTILEEVIDLADLLASEDRGSATILRIPNDTDLSVLTIASSEFEVILLDFPTYKDGRAFSQARVLRERFGFTGDIRATGEVLRDQLLFMARCGFSSFEITEDNDLADFDESLGEISHYYQPAMAFSVPDWALRLDQSDAARLSA